MAKQKVLNFNSGKEGLPDWSWMDPSKREQFANMESQMLDEYTQNIIKNGLRPMFEFSFFKVSTIRIPKIRWHVESDF